MIAAGGVALPISLLVQPAWQPAGGLGLPLFALAVTGVGIALSLCGPARRPDRTGERAAAGRRRGTAIVIGGDRVPGSDPASRTRLDEPAGDGTPAAARDAAAGSAGGDPSTLPPECCGALETVIGRGDHLLALLSDLLAGSEAGARTDDPGPVRHGDHALLTATTADAGGRAAGRELCS